MYLPLYQQIWSLTLWHRTAVAAFSSMLGFAWLWAVIDSQYHIVSFIGRTLLRQPASQWPPNSHRPWLATSVHDFWSFRWHQLLRHFFVTFGARPCGKSSGGGFTKATGLRVRGLLGWLWTMTWTVFWGAFLHDAWARRGLFSTEIFPDYVRPGKFLVNIIMQLSRSVL
ncbi:hypothetical protein B0F90DRAFT_1747190 [Multifurca ochricompacta]|uniref:Wax synthase domain-containing protein n=1 Tax=Multifurca ochricompacta TaxID=376703 RepID=A0AAD4M1G7_9AGAM|nr:hypothetical protein B0F90DRAFT_1747190 [Multifurca ochricompacta]